MADGSSKNIEDVEEGDEVLCFDYETQEYVKSKVVETYINDADTLYIITLEDGSVITTTSEHPFFVVGKNEISEKRESQIGNVFAKYQHSMSNMFWFDRKHFVGWIAAKDLKQGYVLKTTDGRYIAITDVKIKYENVKVFNFHVAKYYNYLVAASESSSAVLVHNACGKPKGGSGGKKRKGGGKNAEDGRINDKPYETGGSGYSAPFGVWKNLGQKHKKIYRWNGKKGKKARYYKWDPKHGNIEVIDSNYRHIGVMDPETGIIDTSKAVKGRQEPGLR